MSVDKEWLNSLRPGCKVFLKHGDLSSIKVVERLTPTQIKLKGFSDKFYKNNGLKIGEPGYAANPKRIVKLTEKIQAEYYLKIEKKELVQFIRKINFNNVDIRKLKEIKDILD